LDIQSPAQRAVKRAGIVDEIRAESDDHPAIIGAAGAIQRAGRALPEIW